MDMKKYDQGKIRYDLIPPECLRELAKVLTYGIEKYKEADSWQTVPEMERRYYSALMRHLEEWRGGNKEDAESHLRHLSHVLCNALFLLWSDINQDKK